MTSITIYDITIFHMAELHENNLVDALTQEMYRDCYEHIGLYDKPAGLMLTVGDTGWRVRYAMPSFTGAESLELTRGWPELVDPVSYQIKRNGTITKNEVVSRYHPGGVAFNPNTEQEITDLHEINILQAIIRAAHEQHQ